MVGVTRTWDRVGGTEDHRMSSARVVRYESLARAFMHDGVWGGCRLQKCLSCSKYAFSNSQHYLYHLYGISQRKGEAPFKRWGSVCLTLCLLLMTGLFCEQWKWTTTRPCQDRTDRELWECRRETRDDRWRSACEWMKQDSFRYRICLSRSLWEVERDDTRVY